MFSFVISRHYQPVPVYHALLHQDGVHLPSAATSAQGSVRTADQMMSTDMRFLPPDMSVEQAWRAAQERDDAAYLVGTRDRLLGTVTREQLEDLQATGRASDPVSLVVNGAFVHAHPDHPIDIVLDRLSESGGVLPVVSRSEARRVEGVITHDSLLNRRSGRAS
jgi:CBS domain-containing protein